MLAPDLGRVPSALLSYGVYALNGKTAFGRGVYEAGKVRPLNADEITEDHASSSLVQTNGSTPLSRGLTLPDADAAGVYSWCKAPPQSPKWGTRAPARVWASAYCEYRHQGRKQRAKPHVRMIEVARLVPLIERWIYEVRPGDPFCLPRVHAGRGQGRRADRGCARGAWPLAGNP